VEDVDVADYDDREDEREQRPAAEYAEIEGLLGRSTSSSRASPRSLGGCGAAHWKVIFGAWTLCR
jgi:hypothetical protein